MDKIEQSKDIKNTSINTEDDEGISKDFLLQQEENPDIKTIFSLKEIIILFKNIQKEDQKKYGIQALK